MILKKLLTILICVLFSTSLMADWKLERSKIDYLINEVSKIDGTFIRNGTEHTPKEASDHLKMKLNNALSSWFTPSKDKWTAKLFIDKVASKSSFSGKEYSIKFSNGSTSKAKSFLLEKLKAYPGKNK